MKPRIQLAFRFFIAITMVQSATADPGTWTGTTTGTWNTTDTNWSGLVAGTPWDATNGQTNDATFNLASLAAVVSGPVHTNGITFSTTGALSGSTINLAGSTPFISVASSQTGTIASVIAGSAGLNKTGTGTLTLQGANSFSGGLAIKAGTVLINPPNGFTNPLGTGTVTIGDSANTGAAATLWLSASFGFGAFSNPLVSTGTGSNILGVTGWNPTFNGGLTLSSNLTIASNNSGGSNFNINGGVTGTGNITVSINNNSNNSYVNFGTAPVNNSGTLTYNNAAVNIGSVTGVAGTGTGTNNITGGVGSNVTGITQASNSNPLTISTNALTVNAAGTTLTASGSAQFTVSSSVTGTGNLILNTDNNSRGFLLSGTSVNNTGTLTHSGTGTAFTTISAGIGSSVTSLTNSGPSGLILSGTNTYTGGSSITAGALYFLNTNAKPASGTHAFSAGTTLGLGVATSGSFFTSSDLDNAFSGTMTGNLSNVTVTTTTNVGIDTTQGNFTYTVSGSPTKGLTKRGANTLTLTGANTHTGATTISGGTLQLGDGGTTGSLATTSTITNNGTFSVNRSNAVVQGTDFSGAAITGTGSFIQAGSGTTTLSNATYSGGTTVNAGRLILVNTMTGSASFSVASGANLEFNTTGATNTGRVLSGGTISGSGNLVKSGDGRLILNNVQTVALTGANSIIDVQGGVLRNDNGNSAWGSNLAGLTVASGAIFDIWDGTARVDELNGAGTINKGWSGDKTLTIGVNNGSGTFSGLILNNANLGYGGSTGGNLLLTKQGSGMQILSGNNTYAGTTTISAGTLQIGAGTDAGSINSSGSIVNNGALVYNVGSGTRTSNAISGSGSLTQNSVGGNLTLSGLNTYTGATLVNAGALTVSGAGTLSGTTSLTVSSGGRFNYLPTAVGTILTLGTGSTLTLNDGASLGLAWDTSTANKITALGAATIGTGAGVFLHLTGTPTTGIAYTLLAAGSGLDTGNYVFVNATNYSMSVGKTATALTVTPTTQTALTAAFWKGGLSGFTNAWALSDGTASNWVADVGGTSTALVPGSGADVTISATSVTTAPTATVLGADMTIKSLTIADTVNGLGLNADGYTLTIANAAGITMNVSGPTSTIAAKVALGASQTWTNHSANALNVSGVVSGAFGLTKAGTGTLSLSGANTYTGATTISAGTVQLGNATALGTTAGNTTIASGATLDLNGQTIAENFGTIVGTGVGTNGALINSSGTAASITGTITQGGAGPNFTVGGAGNITLSTVGGTATHTLRKIGAGTLTLGGTNDNGYLALTVVANSGTVVLGKTGTATGASGAHSIGGGSSVGSGSTVQLAGSGAGQIYGGATLTVSSGGVLNLNGMSQNYGGLNGNLNLNGTGISNGGALINNTGTLSTITIGSGTVALQSATSIGGSGNITIADASPASAAITNIGALTKIGTGTLTLSGTNTYSGSTTVSGGTLTIATTGTINGTSGVTIGTASTNAVAELNYNHLSTALSKPVAFALGSTGGMLSGTGTITQAVTITSGNRQTAGTSVTAANPTATLGKETFSTGITYDSGSIFEWNLNSTAVGTRGDVNGYDAVNTAALGGTGGAIFRVILINTENFSEAFWNADHTWAGIFKNLDETSTYNLLTVFSGGFEYQNFTGTVSGVTSNQGAFSFINSGQDLRWTAVPEPTSALVGLLITAGLLRRRRR